MMIAFACLSIGLTAGFILKGFMELPIAGRQCTPEKCTERCRDWGQCVVKWSD